VPDGWVAEIAIPFRSISYVPGQTNWGFDFTRNIRRKTEIVRWSSLNPALPLTDVSEAGTLTGSRTSTRDWASTSCLISFFARNTTGALKAMARA
jgi:hypothetical protein